MDDKMEEDTVGGTDGIVVVVADVADVADVDVDDETGTERDGCTGEEITMPLDGIPSNHSFI